MKNIIPKAFLNSFTCPHCGVWLSRTGGQYIIMEIGMVLKNINQLGLELVTIVMNQHSGFLI